MSKSKQNYSESLGELELILSELEKSDSIDLDMIERKVKRAAELISLCKDQLGKIDEELNTILNELD